MNIHHILTPLLLIPLTSLAATGTGRTSLAQCLQLAAEHSPTLRAADLLVERARALQGTAWDIDRTELSLSQDPTSGGSPDNAIALSQSIEFPTVYAARRSQLKAETRAEESRRNVATVQLRADIAAAYWQLVYSQERVRILAAQDSLLQRYADMARTRYKAGEARQLEALAANRMLRENALELASARREFTTGQRLLASLIGTTTAIVPADTALTALDYQPTEFVYAATSDGELAYNELTVADKALRVAKNGYAPSLSLALKNQLVISGWDPYHENRSRYTGGNFMGFEVGIGIPLFYGATKARVKAARKDREIAEANMHSRQTARQAEHDAALARYTAALARLRYYDGEGMAAASETARLGTVEYENGEISYIEYNAALQEAADTRMQRATAINDYNQAVIALQRMQ